MPHLKNKSETNQLAAALLYKNNLYSSVVHCAYYSCLQLIKHYALLYNLTTEENIKASRESSHDHLINTIVSHFQAHKIETRTFNNNILQLKKLRTAADYKNEMIDSAKGNSSITLADIVLKNLNQNLR